MPDERPGDEPNIGLLLFIPYRALESRVFEALAEAGYGDVTPAQARVFQRIGPHGTRLTELAEQAQVTKQTAGFLVDQLERAGYVRRTPDPADARARLVRIADRGAAAIPVAAAAVARVEAEWSAALGPRQLAQLRRGLIRLRAITDPYA
jgi:DNA-binding MarR family transcriptional regulator